MAHRVYYNTVSAFGDDLLSNMFLRASPLRTSFEREILTLVVVMIEKGTYVELAKANATAVNGMQPKISVWNTGSEAGSARPDGQGSGQDTAATMRNVSLTN